MGATIPCPSDEQLNRFVDEEAAAGEAAAVRGHVERCNPCLARWLTIVRRGQPKPGAVVVGRFQLTRCLGRGGMGEVWEALRLGTTEYVAIKFLNGRESEFATRLVEREARIGQDLASAGFVRVYEVLRLKQGQPALVMELLSGCDLNEYRRRRGGRLDLASTLLVLESVARSLCLLHRAGVVHRDLKGQNVFVELDPSDDSTIIRVLIIDLGLARFVHPGETITKRGDRLGTPRYCSPEQLMGLGNITTAADIWSLGALTHLLIAGEHFVLADDPHDAVRDVLRLREPNLDRLSGEAPEPLRELIRASLQPEPEKRPSALQWYDVISTLLSARR